MNEANEAQLPIWVVTYQYISNLGGIHYGRIAVHAEDEEGAKELGFKRLVDFGIRHPKVTRAKPYG